jgi:flagellin
MVNNLQVGVENLTASESRIRDADMALEMVSFTKSQILLQAGTAMMAQANNVPQSVLRLMQ